MRFGGWAKARLAAILGAIGAMGVFVATVFDRVSGVPDPGVYRWNKEISPLAWLFAHVFIALRLISPLQWIKVWVRGWKPARPDFHARKTEYYFLTVGTIVVAIWWWRDSSLANITPMLIGDSLDDAATSAATFVTTVWLIESFVWLSYYCLWRNFMEPSYTLYHRAEYIVLFPVILCIQIFAIATLLRIDPGDVLNQLFGQGEHARWYLTYLGWYYLAVLYTAIASAVPPPNIKP